VENQRTLHWRGETDPYKIWVSEIILQQTRVNQGWQYYVRFIERFPNVKTLAKASLHEVLHIWQGLGYYTRARNLHEAAQQIMQNHQGAFPDNYSDIRKLKGVGNYTAAAISSIAFQLCYPAVDGNVLRVIARIFGIYDDISQQKTIKKVAQLCEKMMDKEKPGGFNQALMEFGAILCTPKNPKCENCPFVTCCIAFKEGHQVLLPVKSLKIKVKNRYFHYFFFINNTKTTIEQRTENDIWKNLYQFPLIETNKHYEKLSQKIISDAGFGKCKPIFVKEVKHKLTHQHLTIKFYEINSYFPEIKNDWVVVSMEDLETYPFPVVLKNLIEENEKGASF
jgi:A/G-specific adenine glycosylase